MPAEVLGHPASTSAVTGPQTGLWLGTLASEPGPGEMVVLRRGERALTLLTPRTAPSAASSATLDGLAVVFDGRVFNSADLSARLGLPATTSDAALVLHAYRHWREGLLAHLQGHFAFGLWDADAGVLLLARDRVGIVPMFYRDTADGLTFSSTLTAHLSLAGRSPDLSRTALSAYLARQTLTLEETFFEGVKRVPPGHALLARGAERRVWRHWQPPPPGAGADWVREDELPRFGELLAQAVDRALAHGPAGVYLSGGLDSVSVAAVAAERSYEAPWGLSLAFPGDVSEAEVQTGVAKTLGLPHLLLPFETALGDQGLLGAALELSATWPTPLQNVWLPAYHRLGAEGSARGCRAILTGGGGDEWLTVTPLLAADLIRRGDIAGLFDYLQAAQRSLRLPSRALARNVLWTNGALPLAQDTYRTLHRHLAPGLWNARMERALAAATARLPGWVAADPALRRDLEARVTARAQARALASAPGPGGYYYREMETSLNHPLFALDVEEIHESGRRLGMPEYNIYWDADLIEFLYRVPPKLLNRGGRSKGLVRDELAKRFPNLGFDRQKKLISRDFFRDTVLGEGAAAWRALGGARALGELGVVDRSATEQMMGDILATRAHAQVDRFWHVLSLEAWVRSRLDPERR